VDGLKGGWFLLRIFFMCVFFYSEEPVSLMYFVFWSAKVVIFDFSVWLACFTVFSSLSFYAFCADSSVFGYRC